MTWTSFASPRFSSAATLGSRRREERPPPPPPLPAPVPAPVAIVFVVVIGGLLVLLGLDQVGGVEEGALVSPDVDECGLDSRKHGLDRAQVDIAHHAAGVRTIDQELNKAVVLQDRDAGLARGPADENFPFQSKCPRPRSANSRSGSYDCSSKNSCQADRLRMS